jgi:serine/threonine protein kinase
MDSVIYNTVLAESAERSIELLLAPYLAPSQATRKAFTETDIRQISDGLRRMGKDSWSRVPRLYTILRMVNQVQVIDSFVAQGVSDIWFPFSLKTLPEILRAPSSRFEFLEAQDLVLTKAFDLEREDGKHRHFSKAEDVPMRKLEELGKGGFGYVDRVVSTITYKEYARKLIPRGRTFKKNMEVLKDFERELGHLKKLSHIHIVKLIGSYTDPKFVGIIMSPVAEYNLKDFLALDPLPPGERSFLRTFFGCLAAALCYLHDNRIRHKDIKPQNVLVKGHQIFLTDFGISLDWSELGQSTTTGVTIKTPRYCAPEVAESMPRNSFSDLWSLGCVFLEIWTTLKGSPIAALLEYLNNHGSKSTCYHLNRDACLAWCRSLEAEVRPEENPPLPWIVGLLQPDQDQRWTARKLFDQIQEVNDDPDNRFAFSGLCCINDDDSTQSAGSSKRSSRNLEETGASSIGVYYDPRMNQDTADEAAAKDLSSSQTVRPSEMNTFSAKHLEYNFAPLPSESDVEACSPPMCQIKTLEHIETLQNAPIIANATTTRACSQIPMSRDTASQSSVSSIATVAADDPSSEHVQTHGYATMPVQEQATEPSELNEDERRQEPDGRAFHAEALRKISEVDKTTAEAVAHEEREQMATGVESPPPSLEVRKRRLNKYTPLNENEEQARRRKAQQVSAILAPQSRITREHTSEYSDHVGATRRASTGQVSVVPEDAGSSSALATSFQNQFDAQIGTTGPPPAPPKPPLIHGSRTPSTTDEDVTIRPTERKLSAYTPASTTPSLTVSPALKRELASWWKKARNGNDKKTASSLYDSATRINAKTRQHEGALQMPSDDRSLDIAQQRSPSTINEANSDAEKKGLFGKWKNQIADSREERMGAITTKEAPTRLRRAFSFEKTADETLPVVAGNDTEKKQQSVSQDKSTLTKTIKTEKATGISKSEEQELTRTCRICNEKLTGQFARALGGTYHLNCFTCRVTHTLLSESDLRRG